jgi:isopropylmalate/homocitrate/citramalate synthase
MMKLSPVRIREVGPRDGFQNEPEIIPTRVKVERINALARTGVPRLEITSFVRADVIPQLADAPDVLRPVEIPEGVRRSVLIGGWPVPKGATGNVATEDVVSMLHELGAPTGIDPAAPLECSRWVRRELRRPLGSHTMTAGPIVWNE